MSATVIPFPREPVGPVFLRSPSVQRADVAAIRDAQNIRAAKRENDDWTARLLLALIETLNHQQLDMLEFRMLGPALDTEAAVQALSVVQYIKGTNAHRARVKAALVRLQGGDQ